MTKKERRNNNHDDSTVVFTDIREALAVPEQEASDRPAALLAVGGELNGTLFDLLPGETSVGRSPSSSISLEFKGISRDHFKIMVKDESAVLQDLGSRNGTYLNNKKIEGHIELKQQDIIKIGAIALKYIPKGDPERLAYDKLNMEASTDGLTGCFNKTYFYNCADLEVKKSKITGAPLSLIIFDLDHFKKLNDTYGHDAGDYVLKTVAQLVRSGGIRDQDIFARYGGEEFVVLLPRTNIKQAYEIAERLRRLVEEFNFLYENQTLPVFISVGVADYRHGVESGTDLFKRSDAALYKSKDGGRNQVNFYKE